jgi:uncharacterized protein (DUF58 family)
MWFSNIFRRLDPGAAQAGALDGSLADVAFLRRLDRLALRTSRLLRGEAPGQRPSWRRLPANDFREHRLYLPGDDLRHVDWNASARSEHVFVKLGERPREVAIQLLLDTTPSMNWGQPSKLWAARRLAAAMGYLTLKHGDRLSIALLSDEGAGFGPSRGKGRIPAMLRYLRDAPVSPRADVTALARRAAASRPSGGLVVILSDLLDLPDLPAVLECFRPPKWQTLVLHVLHPAELRPDVDGELELQDAETQRRENYDVDAPTLAKYSAFASAWCERIEQTCYEAGAAYARPLADWPIERAVMPYLRRRGIVLPA